MWAPNAREGCRGCDSDHPATGLCNAMQPPRRLANSRSPCKLAHLTHFLVAMCVTIEFFTTSLKLVPVGCVSECPSGRIVVSRVQIMTSAKKIVPASPEELKLQSRVMESLAHPLYR